MSKIKEINGYPHIKIETANFSTEKMKEKSEAYLKLMEKRRSIRAFSDQNIDISIIENIIKTAATAPSGANKQPWTFCLISNPVLKKQIREAAEKEEALSYNNRMSEQWLRDLAPLGTDSNKPFLTTAPYLLVVCKRIFEYDKQGEKLQNYYVSESVGIACGILISAIHNAGLATLTHTPSPMNFLSKLLNRPDNERPFLLLPIGKAAEEVYVPHIKKKKINDICVHYK